MPNSQIINASLVSSTNPLFQYLKKKQENDRFSKIIELSATIGLILALLFFAIMPTVGTISNLYTEIESKKQLKVELKTKINQVLTAQANFAEFQKRYYLVENALPGDEELANTIVQVVGFQLKNNIPVTGVSLDRISPVNPSLATKDKDLRALSFGVSKTLSFSEISSLLISSRNLRRLSYYDSISLISEENKDTKTNSIKIAYNPQLYYLSSLEKTK